MGRPQRIAEGGRVYHVLNRANARLPIFEKDEDYRVFERVLTEVQERVAMRILAYCLMPNHWHLVVWPRREMVIYPPSCGCSPSPTPSAGMRIAEAQVAVISTKCVFRRR